MRRAILFLSFLLAGCGGDVTAGDGTASLFFSDDVDFGPSTIAITGYDDLEGSEDDGISVYLKQNARTLEIDLPSGRTTDLENDLQASVFLDDPFGEAEGVAGTVTVLGSSSDRIWLRLDDVILADRDGAGKATISGTVEVRNVVPSRRGKWAGDRLARQRLAPGKATVRRDRAGQAPPVATTVSPGA